MASVKYNPKQVVLEVEDLGFEYDYPDSGQIIVSDQELKFDYLIVLPGDEEILDGVYKLVRVGDVNEVEEIEDDEEAEDEVDEDAEPE